MHLLLSFVLANTGTTIVYCRSIAMVIKVCQYLRYNVDAAQKQLIKSFHANLTSDYKDGILKMLKAGDVLKAVVATEALGMVSNFFADQVLNANNNIKSFLGYRCAANPPCRLIRPHFRPSNSTNKLEGLDGMATLQHPPSSTMMPISQPRHLQWMRPWCSL